MSLAEFARAPGPETATITVLNPEQESPVYRMLSELFSDEAITVQHTTTGERTGLSDVVLVERPDDDTAFAVSSLDRMQEELLLVNSDIYVTGARELADIETPDAVTNLDGLPFTVRGYPEKPQEKLLLVEMSRHIEAMAWQSGEGHLIRTDVTVFVARSPSRRISAESAGLTRAHR